MAKVTRAKLARKFGVDEEGKRFERQTTLPPKNVERMPACRVCHNMIPVGDGQVAHYHRECRQYRKKAQRSVITPSKKIV